MERRRTPDGYDGWYDADRNVIVVDSNLSDARMRSVLAHELVHAERHDRRQGDAWTELQQEHHVDMIAARLLLPLDVLADALCGAEDEFEVAVLLVVDVETLRARLADLTAAETQYVSDRVRATTGREKEGQGVA